MLFNWKNDEAGNTPFSAENLNLMQQMIVDTIYPVGSIIMNVNSTNPGDYIPNTTWEQYAQGKTIVGVDSNDSDFGIVEKTGGEKTHNHLYGFKFAAYFGATALEQNNKVGILKDGNGEAQPWQASDTQTGIVNNNVANNTKTETMSSYKAVTTTSSASSLQPYITTYIWKRTK